jgi:hypothetical protein
VLKNDSCPSLTGRSTLGWRNLSCTCDWSATPAVASSARNGLPAR